MPLKQLERRIGKRFWAFPDAELPPAGNSTLKGHESVIILNMTGSTAHVVMTLYFEDGEPLKGIAIAVLARRVRRIRMDQPENIGGFVVPINTQYAITLRSDRPIIAQYGRPDARQTNLAFYATSGFSE